MTIYAACPDCGGTGGDAGSFDDEPADVCLRCRGNGSLPESDLTPEELAEARRTQEEDDRWRSKVDF